MVGNQEQAAFLVHVHGKALLILPCDRSRVTGKQIHWRRSGAYVCQSLAELASDRQAQCVFSQLFALADASKMSCKKRKIQRE